MLLPGMQAAAAAQGGCPPHEQATRLVQLGMEKRDAALLRAVLGCTALRPYLCDGAWLAERLSLAAIARDPGEGMLRALLDSGVGVGPEHQAARDEALGWAVGLDRAGAARLLLAAGAEAADAGKLLRDAIQANWINELRQLADLGVRFSACDNGGLLGHAARWGSPAVVSELLRHDTWERGPVRAALEVATAHNRAEVAGLLRGVLAAVAAVGSGGGGVWTAVRRGLYILGELVSLAAGVVAFMPVVWALLVQCGAAEELRRGLLHLWGRGADGQAEPQQ
ncbi:hypothetical protein TSOC_015033, partial [Tetrabaena socialis]